MALKAIILDLDNTLYVNDHMKHEIDSKTEAFLIDHSPTLTQEELVRLEHRMPNILDALIDLGLDKHQYTLSVYGKLQYEHIVDDFQVSALLRTLRTDKFVVSLAPPGHIRSVLSRLGVADQLKKSISLHDISTTNKETAYNIIARQNEYKNEDVLVIGDNYLLDILPAIKLGMKTILISKHRDFAKKPTFIVDNITEALLRCRQFDQ